MPVRVRWLAYCLFLISGATALVYQVTWVRNLSLIFGASFQATSIVLASFMAGLALGGFLLGRRSRRIRRPLRLYGFLEIGVAIFAFLLPTLLGAIDSLYVQAALRSDGVDTGLTLMRIALAFGALVIPTFFMGGTLPVLIACLVHRRGELAVRLAWLYGINTLGAVGGALSAGFILIPAFGVWHTQLIAVGVNLVVGTIALLADPGDADVPVDAAAGAADLPAPGALADGPDSVRVLPWRLAFWGTAVGGMCALALEVLWTRAITIAVGSTTYSFTVMLAAFLLGIWLGSWIHAALPLHRIPASLQFGVVLVLVGFSSFAVSHWIPRLPELAVRFNLDLYGDAQRVRAATTLLVAFVAMLPPCVFMGMAFPLAGQARAHLSQSFGQSVGDTLGLNTLGSIAGSLLAGFALIPSFGLQKSMLLASSMNIAFGTLVLGAVLMARVERRRGLVLAGTLVTAASAFVLVGLGRPWDTRMLGAFNNNAIRKYIRAGGSVDVRGSVATTTLPYYREGRGSTVSVVERDGQRALLINGKAVATDHLGEVHNQLLLGHLPVLLHDAPTSALVVGLGAGMTLGAVAAHGAIEDLALVEIEPAVLGAAEQFADFNDDVLLDPRLRISFQDGRNFLKTTSRKFDVITADPIHPWAYGSVYLYTVEYYQLAKARLNVGGIMCQWLPAYGLSTDEFRSVVATFARAFDEVTAWQASMDVLLIGSDAPVRIDLAGLERRMAEPTVARQLAWVGLETPLAFLADFAMDDAAVRRYGRGAMINTDDNLYLEFSSPKSVGTPGWVENLRAIDEFRTPAVRVAANLSSRFPSLEVAQATLSRYQSAKSATVKVQLQPRKRGRIAALQETIQSLRSVLAELPDYGRARIELADQLTRLAEARLSQGRPQLAAERAREALELRPDDAIAHHRLGAALTLLGESLPAIEHLEIAARLRPYYWHTYFVLALALEDLGRTREAIDFLREGMALRPGNPEMEKLLVELRASESNALGE